MSNRRSIVSFVVTVLAMAVPANQLWAGGIVLSKANLTITHQGVTPGSCAASLAGSISEPCDSFTLKLGFKATPKSNAADKADIVDDLTKQLLIFFFSPDPGFCSSGSLTDAVEARIESGSLVNVGGAHWGFTGVTLGADFATLKQFSIFVNLSLTVSKAAAGTITVQGSDSFESFIGAPIALGLVIGDKDGDPTVGNTELYCTTVTPTYLTQNF